MLRSLLAHPLTRQMRVDDPRTTELRRQIICSNRFLQQVYREWYRSLLAVLPTEVGGPILELGAGAGFLADYLPDLITSEVFYCTDIRVVLDGHDLPFAEGTLCGIVMTDVLHHLPRPRRFLGEAARCVRVGGVIAAIEPWVSRWSRFVYGRLHHEPFRPDAMEWEFPPNGPLSGANGALPWILFERDRTRFEQEFPQWDIREVQLGMPFRYLVSGGVSMRPLMPVWTFGTWTGLENALGPWMKDWAMFARIVLIRTGYA